MFIQLLAVPVLLLLVLFVLFSVMLDVCFVCESNFLPTCHWSSTSHILFRNMNSSISSTPNRTGPSPCTIKNLHLITLSSCLNQTKQMPNFFIFELFYIFISTDFFVACNNSTFAFGNKHLNILNGMKIAVCPRVNFICFFGLPLTCA